MQDQMPGTDLAESFDVAGHKYSISHGDVVIAAITSCTNTSNPDVMIAAAMVARKAAKLGLKVKPWVKTSLAPGSRVVERYLSDLGFMADFEAIGYNLVGFGCTTCIGNSGPLAPEIDRVVRAHDVHVSSVLSGNRNFDGRVHPLTKSNWLASPPLVVVYALAGTTTVDLTTDPIAHDSSGNPVMLADIWPNDKELAAAVAKIERAMFKETYSNLYRGTSEWRDIPVTKSLTYGWDKNSTYIRRPSFFAGMKTKPAPLVDINGARILMLLGASVTTDHISPAGNISSDSPAGSYLREHGVSEFDFNSYGSRRGNHEVMMRGTLANIRIRNKMTGSKEGGYTRLTPDGDLLSVYDAAMEYAKHKTPTVIVAKRENGTGSSRDWAAKGVNLLGVKAVIAESFERIHRSNLLGMGVLPLRFIAGDSQVKWELTGYEKLSIRGITQMTEPGAEIEVEVEYLDGRIVVHKAIARIETHNELMYYRHGGILPYVLRKLVDNN
jgi:aconitate hydratase